MNEKHAYILLVHENNYVLKTLLRLIDHVDNDIFIHIDRKKNNIKKSELYKLVKSSKMYIMKRYKVNWGTPSILKAEIFAINYAINTGGGYKYFHLISGADLIIKKHSEVVKFFEQNDGKEFVHFGSNQYQSDIKSRYDKYHFFVKQLGRNYKSAFWRGMETYSLAVQRRLNIDRTRKDKFNIYGGSNWCSITNDFARYIVDNYKKYIKRFRYTQMSDEMLIHTMIMDSPYKNNLYKPGFDDNYVSCMRYIDWNRGNPYVFHKEDYEDILLSKCIFARKFDERVDRQIIEMLYQQLRDKE